MKRHHKIAGLLAGAIVLALGVADAAENASSASAAQLYNAANAAARNGDVGRAVLDYERARLLSPRDPDSAANLALTRARAALPTPPSSRLHDFPMQLTIEAWCAIALGALWLACGAVALSSVCWRRPFVAFAFVAASIAGTSLGAITLRAMHDDTAVVLEQGSLGLSPFPDAAAVGTLVAGQEVRMGARHGRFVRVVDDGGRAGWVLSSAVQRVVPEGA